MNAIEGMNAHDFLIVCSIHKRIAPCYRANFPLYLRNLM